MPIRYRIRYRIFDVIIGPSLVVYLHHGGRTACRKVNVVQRSVQFVNNIGLHVTNVRRTTTFCQ